MRILLQIVLCASLFLNTEAVQSQVLISTSIGTLDSTSILEVRSTDKGFLPPRMSENERDAIINPTAGLMIYCTDCKEMQMYNDTAWTNMIGLPATPAIVVIDYGGQTYNTVKIGSQRWMAENLNIGVMVNDSANQPNNSIIEKYCYDNDTANCITYGGLYQWGEMMQFQATESIQGICPTGWHLPSDNEFKILEMQLGMTQAQVDSTGYRGTDQASQLAGADSLWLSVEVDIVQNAAFGSSGFNALPSGYRHPSGASDELTAAAPFWTSTGGTNPKAASRLLYYFTSKIARDNTFKTFGNAVRCVQD